MGDFDDFACASDPFSAMAYYRDQSQDGQSATARILITTTGSSQAQTLEEEMGSRFPQCRRGRPYPHTQALQASQFNPYNRRGPPPSRISSNRSTGKAFTRTVFVLDHGEDSIPRGPTRQFMYEEGRVVDFLELNTAMTNKAVYETIENVFVACHIGSVLEWL